jgi:hypothetical protein
MASALARIIPARPRLASARRIATRLITMRSAARTAGYPRLTRPLPSGSPNQKHRGCIGPCIPLTSVVPLAPVRRWPGAAPAVAARVSLLFTAPSVAVPSRFRQPSVAVLSSWRGTYGPMHHRCRVGPSEIWPLTWTFSNHGRQGSHPTGGLRAWSSTFHVPSSSRPIAAMVQEDVDGGPDAAIPAVASGRRIEP